MELKNFELMDLAQSTLSYNFIGLDGKDVLFLIGQQ